MGTVSDSMVQGWVSYPGAGGCNTSALLGRQRLRKEDQSRVHWNQVYNNQRQPTISEIADSYPLTDRTCGSTNSDFSLTNRSERSNRSVPARLREQKLGKLKEDLLSTLEDIERQLLASQGSCLSSSRSG